MLSPRVVFVLFLIILCLFQSVLSHLTALPASRKKVGRVPLWNATLVDKLKQDLLLNYDKFARPTQHTNVTTVRFGLEIKHVDVNEFKSTVVIVGWARLIWSDDKLKWNTENYGGVDVIHVAPHEVWQPDIVLQNSATATGIAQDTVYLLAYSNGEVLWVPPSTFPVLCDFNFETWPFDQHRCKLVIGSWTYHSDYVKLEFDGNDDKKIVNDRTVDGYLDWNLTDFECLIKTKEHCCGNSFSTLEINFTVQRITNSYKSLILTPMIVIVILTLLSFWLPPKSEEKILLNIITTSIIVILMLYFTQNIPYMGYKTPLIVKFYTSTLIVTTLSLTTAVLTITLSKTPRKSPISWTLKSILIGRLGVYLGLSNYITQANLGNSQRNKHQENKENMFIGKYQEDWILLAAAIDRISFLFYSIVFIILTSKYFV